jgi:hypothetical protein
MTTLTGPSNNFFLGATTMWVALFYSTSLVINLLGTGESLYMVCDPSKPSLLCCRSTSISDLVPLLWNSPTRTIWIQSGGHTHNDGVRAPVLDIPPHNPGPVCLQISGRICLPRLCEPHTINLIDFIMLIYISQLCAIISISFDLIILRVASYRRRMAMATFNRRPTEPLPPAFHFGSSHVATNSMNGLTNWGLSQYDTTVITERGGSTV